MPELPEVESLVRFLRQQADGRVIDRADSAAISVLKTYRPDLTALRGRTVTDTRRHGKFLDLVAVAAGATAAATGASPLTAPCTWSSTWPGPDGSAGGRTSPGRRRARARARSPSGCGSLTAPAST